MKAPSREVSLGHVRSSVFFPDPCSRLLEQSGYIWTGPLVVGSDPQQVLRVNVTEGTYLWKDTVWVNVKAEGIRVLERDIVQIWGIGAGEREYAAVLGNQIRVPQMDAYAVEVVVKAGDR